ncbi:MAG: hypothetical protein LBO71_03105 [Prevotellaceae bacterium]|jgi:hypothetical protein|nr:hypothetical protein [Prevotellaceae bacterium]
MKIFLSDNIRGKVAEALMYLTFAGYFLLYFLLPQLGLDAVAPLLFALFAAIFRGLMARWKRKVYAGKKSVQHIFSYFLTWKLAKMLVGVVAIVCCMKFFGEHLRAFLISFALFYLELMWVEIAAWRSVEQKKEL